MVVTRVCSLFQVIKHISTCMHVYELTSMSKNLSFQKFILQKVLFLCIHPTGIFLDWQKLDPAHVSVPKP